MAEEARKKREVVEDERIRRAEEDKRINKQEKENERI